MELSRRECLGIAAGTAALALSGTSALAAADEKSKPGKTPHTKFAVNIEMWWKKLPSYVDRIKKTADFGFPAVEFWPFETKKIDEISSVCRSLNIAVAQFTAWGFYPGLNEKKNHDAFVKKIELACKAAKDLDCKLMTVVAGQNVRGLSHEQMHEHVIEGLKRAVPICEKHDVTMILEPMNIRVDHKGHCLYGSVEPVKICKAVGSKYCKLNWDLYHMHITEGDLCRRLKEGFSEVGYLQIADNPGRFEPGTGEIYYPRVLKEAYDLGYRGYVGLECNPKEGEEKAAARVAAADWT